MNLQFLQLGERLKSASIEILQNVIVQHKDFETSQALKVVGFQCGQVVREECEASERDDMQKEISWYAAEGILTKQQLIEVRQLSKGKTINLKGQKQP